MTSKRWIIAALWFASLANYFDRTLISFAGPMIMKSLHLDARTFGVVLSFFALGYVLAQIPGGLVSDRWGAKPMIVVAPLLWALFTGLTGLVTTVGALVAIRLLLGAAEGASLGASYKIQADNFAPRERSLVQGLTLSSIALAPTIAGPTLGFLMGVMSWQWTFVVLAAPAIAAAAFSALVIPAKGAHGAVGPARSEARKARSTFVSFVRRPSFWIVSFTWFAFNIAYWGFHGWMPSYLAMARHIEIAKVGLYGAVPYLFGALGLVGLGWAGGGLLYRWRPQMLAASYALAAAALFLAFRADSLVGSISGLSAAAFFLFGGIGVFGAMALDLAPADGRATYWAAVSTIGQIAGVIAPSLIGSLVSATKTFAGGFACMAASLCLAAVLVLFLVRSAAPDPAESLAGY